MSVYYLGGYYLIKQQPLNYYSPLKFDKTYTASNCINHSLIDFWAYKFIKKNDINNEAIYENLNINNQKIIDIREWVDEKFKSNDIGWVNMFLNIEAAKLYKKAFFSHLNDVKLIAIYFNESEANKLINDFAPSREMQDPIGLYSNLNKRIAEIEFDNGIDIGFDLIGVEYSGDFHTFYCHPIVEHLTKNFGLQINSFGLINEINDWQPIIEYLNDEATGLEPVPWYVVKLKLIK